MTNLVRENESERKKEPEILRLKLQKCNDYRQWYGSEALVDSSVAHVVLSNVFKARKMLWQGRPAEGPSINNVVNLEREGVQNDLEIFHQI